MRPRDGKVALVLDLAGVSHELGLPDEVREWSLEDGELREPKKAHQRPRDCPLCYTVYYGRICPGCKHAEPMAAVEMVETELEDARTGAPAKAKTGNRRNDLWRDVAIAKKAADPRRALLAVAERRGYKPGMGGAYFERHGKDLEAFRSSGNNASFHNSEYQWTANVLDGDAVSGGRAGDIPCQTRACTWCVTSPPYWGLRDYGLGQWQGGDAECGHEVPEVRPNAKPISGGTPIPIGIMSTVQGWPNGVCGHCGAIQQAAGIGLEPTLGEWVANIVAVMREVRRVLRDDGTCWLNLGDSYAANSNRATKNLGPARCPSTEYALLKQFIRGRFSSVERSARERQTVTT